MNGEITFNYLIPSGEVNYMSNKCHEFIKQHVNDRFTISLSEHTLNVSIDDLKLVIDSINQSNKYVTVEYAGIEKNAFNFSGYSNIKKEYSTHDHLILVKFDPKCLTAAYPLVVMNILRWTFQHYATSTADKFIGFIKEQYDPLVALMLAQTLIPQIGTTPHNIIISRTMEIPKFYSLKKYYKVGTENNAQKYGFQNLFGSGIKVFDNKGIKMLNLIKTGKIDNFIYEIKKHDLWFAD